MSPGIKLVMKIVLRRLEGKLEAEITNNQYGFLKKKSGMKEVIFGLRMLCERCIQIQHKVYLCIIDYEKAFSKVRHEKIIELLNRYQLGHQNIQLIRNLYWKQEAAVRVTNELTSWMKIRKVCVLPPHLFSFYLEWIFRENDTDKSGITIGGRCFNHFRYADDTVLVTTCEDDLRKLIKEVNNKSLEYGLRINAVKTKTVVVIKSNVM